MLHPKKAAIVRAEGLTVKSLMLRPLIDSGSQTSFIVLDATNKLSVMKKKCVSKPFEGPDQPLAQARHSFSSHRISILNKSDDSTPYCEQFFVPFTVRNRSTLSSVHSELSTYSKLSAHSKLCVTILLHLTEVSSLQRWYHTILEKADTQNAFNVSSILKSKELRALSALISMLVFI